MARIRSIKPEFCTSAQVVECSRNARLLFVLMWMHCDDNGIHPASAKQLRMECFPGDDDMPTTAIQGLVDELLAQDLLSEYEHKGQRFWHVTGWKHQRIDKPQPGKYPKPTDPDSTPVPFSFSEHSRNESTNVPGTLPPDRKGREGIGKDQGSDRIGEEGIGLTPLSSADALDRRDDVRRVFEHWRTVMGHPNAQLDDDRRKRIRNALKAGYTVEQLCQAIDGCKLTPHNMGQNDRNGIYDGLHVILRSADQIDRFIRNSQHPPRPIDPVDEFVRMGHGMTIEGEVIGNA